MKFLFSNFFFKAKISKQRGGVRRSGKYELSSFSNFLHSEQTESETKPVVLKMQERKRTIQGSQINHGYRNSREDLTASKAVQVQSIKTKQISGDPEALQSFANGSNDGGSEVTGNSRAKEDQASICVHHL